MSSVTHIQGRPSGDQPPPSIKEACRFSNPLGPSSSELGDHVVVEDVERPPPPDIIDAALAKQLDAFTLLLKATYVQNVDRQCFSLPLPAEMLEYSDLHWVVNKPTAATSPEHGQSPGHPSIPSLAEQCAKHGNKNLETIFIHRQDKYVINSPRSVLVMIKSGLSCESLRQAGDPLTESRRQKTISTLRAEYMSLIEKVSRECIVRYIRRKDSHAPNTASVGARMLHERKKNMKKKLQQEEPSGEVSSPFISEKHRSSVTEATGFSRGHRASITPSVNTAPLASRPSSRETADTPLNITLPIIKETKGRQLDRLLRHRDHITAEWGMRQQTLANAAYSQNRIESQLAKPIHQRSTTPVRRVNSVPLEKSPQGEEEHGQVSSIGGQDHSAAAASSFYNIVRASEEAASPPAARIKTPQPHTAHSLTCTNDRRKTKKLKEEKMEAAKKLFQQREKERLLKVEKELARKGEIADQAIQRRNQEKQEKLRKHADRGREVTEVKLRMNRNQDYKRLLLIRQMEDNTRATNLRESFLTAQQQAIQERHRQRNILDHKTQHFVHEAHAALDKALCYQETMNTSSSPSVVRQIKDESKVNLKKLLQKEDHLIQSWKKLEAQQHGDILSPERKPSPLKTEG